MQEGRLAHTRVAEGKKLDQVVVVHGGRAALSILLEVFYTVSKVCSNPCASSLVILYWEQVAVDPHLWLVGPQLCLAANRSRHMWSHHAQSAVLLYHPTVGNTAATGELTVKVNMETNKHIKPK